MGVLLFVLKCTLDWTTVHGSQSVNLRSRNGKFGLVGGNPSKYSLTHTARNQHSESTWRILLLDGRTVRIFLGVGSVSRNSWGRKLENWVPSVFPVWSKENRGGEVLGFDITFLIIAYERSEAWKWFLNVTSSFLYIDKVRSYSFHCYALQSWNSSCKTHNELRTESNC